MASDGEVRVSSETGKMSPRIKLGCNTPLIKLRLSTGFCEGTVIVMPTNNNTISCLIFFMAIHYLVVYAKLH